jgi:hypothetical protein
VFFHAIREVDEGIEFRSRYWILQTMNRGRPKKCLLPSPHKLIVDLARSICLHSLTEYNNLASFLPQIYHEMEGKI